MTCLNRTTLTIPRKIQCSIQALLAQLYGGMSALSRECDLSRPTLYAAASTVRALQKNPIALFPQNRYQWLTSDSLQ